MKRKFLIIYILIILSAFALTACNTSTPTTNNGSANSSINIESTENSESSDDSNKESSAECQHDFSDWQTVKQPSCLDKGLQIRTCNNCKFTEEETLAITDTHEIVIDEGYPSTCISVGLSDGSHCNVCKKVFVNQEVTPKLEHKFVDGKCFCGETYGLKMALSDDETFYTVTGLGYYDSTAIVIPDTYNDKPVKAIGASAFNGNKTITHVTIGAEIKNIYDWAFFNCTGLTGVSVSSIDAWLDIKFQTSNANPLKHAKTLYIGDVPLTDLVIPNNVEEISKFAFIGCTSLQTLTLGKSVKTINSLAFHSCMELSEITLNDNLEVIEEYAFFDCRKLSTNLSFANGLTMIGEFAFSNNGKLSGVSFGNTLKSIGYCAFQNCVKLTTLTIPASVELIEKYAFQNCTAIESVLFENPIGWQCYHSSYPTSNMGEKALSNLESAANFLTDIYSDREWVHSENS